MNNSREPREELWALACALSPRQRSQLKLLAVQARRASAAGRVEAAPGVVGPPARRWWYFELDYAHPLVLPLWRAPRPWWQRAWYDCLKKACSKA